MPPPIMPDTDRYLPDDGAVTLVFLLFPSVLLASLSAITSSALLSLGFELCLLLRSRLPQAVQHTARITHPFFRLPSS